MEKFFNTAGPIKPELHYYIPFDQRIDWDDIQMLFASQKYFLIHAPRQTGKTTSLLEMMTALNKADKYNVLYVNIEAAQTARNDIDAGMTTICGVLARSAELYLKEPRLQIWLNDKTKIVSPHDRII